MSDLRRFGAHARRLWSVLFGALLAVGLRAADFEHNVPTAPGASVDIRLTVPGGRAPTGGFLPLRVRVANRGSDAGEWTVDLATMMQGHAGGGGQLHSRHSFPVPAGVTREFFVFAPIPESGDGRASSIVNAEVRGPDVMNTGRVMLSLGYTWNSPIAAVAVEPALEADLRTFLTAKYPEATAPAGYANNHQLQQALERVSVIAPEGWPADWRLWSSFSVVLLTEETWAKLDGARRQALLDWVALGGRLLLSPDAPGGGTMTQHGAGRVDHLPVSIRATDPQRSDGLGFHDTRLTGRADALASGTFWDLNAKKWQIGLHAGWLTLFILTFGVLVGPINLFVFAPAHRRHRLFFTVPALSLAASVVLVVIIVVGDGFGGAGARRAVVVLLPEQNQAAVFQRQMSRTGLLSSDDFTLAPDVVLDVEDDPMALQFGGKAIDLHRDGEQVSGDWFKSRATQAHSLRRLVASRERVELVSAPGATPVVQSTVAATLRPFLYKDPANKVWSADEVPPGTRVTLRPWSGPRLAGSIVEDIGHWPPGYFYARGGRADGVPIPTLPSIRWTDEEDRILYSGRLGGEGMRP